MNTLQQIKHQDHFIKSKGFDLMRELSTPHKFELYYFKIIKKFETREKAFITVNYLYFLLFGVYRYSSYNSFKNTINKKSKKK